MEIFLRVKPLFYFFITLAILAVLLVVQWIGCLPPKEAM